MRFPCITRYTNEGEILYHGKDITKMKRGRTPAKKSSAYSDGLSDPIGFFNPKMKIRDIICELQQNFKRIKQVRSRCGGTQININTVDLPGTCQPLSSHYGVEMKAAESLLQGRLL